VFDMTMTEVIGWVWDLNWRWNLFEWQLIILGELIQTLDSQIFYQGVDFWVWSNDSSSIFLVRPTYRFLHRRASELEDVSW